MKIQRGTFRFPFGKVGGVDATRYPRGFVPGSGRRTTVAHLHEQTKILLALLKNILLDCEQKSLWSSEAGDSTPFVINLKQNGIGTTFWFSFD